MFNLVVAGSRSFSDFGLMTQTLDGLLKNVLADGRGPVTIISGTARGADKLGEQYAKLRKMSLKLMPANWDGKDRSLGMKRNVAMADIADAVVCFWDGQSPGTRQMIGYCKSLGKPLRVIRN